MKLSLSPLLLAILMASCNSNHPISQEKISGVYIRETSFEVRHPETGKAIGRSTIRDTLFIQELQQGFQVSQAKWRLNEFDQQGWQNQQHADSRPTPPYQATFDPTNRFIHPVTSGVAFPLFVDVNKAMLYPGKERKQGYRKVK